MKKDLAFLNNEKFDLIIIGGGIFGIASAWDAVCRGLKVALFEKGDFTCGSSSQHFKMIHGGIRYIQHGDIYRIRESVRERRAHLRIAPHLTNPLPIVIPTYGHGIKGKEILSIGMSLYDLFALDRNKGIIDPEQQIPSCQTLSREQTLALFPGLNPENLTGAALFYDGQIYNSPRFGISMLKAAVEKGALAFNYTDVIDITKDGNHITGIEFVDSETGKTYHVEGKVVLNAAGASAHWLLEDSLGIKLNPRPNFSRDTCFLVKRKFSHPYGLAVLGQSKDPDSLLSRNARHLFVIPWREYSLIGVWHKVFDCRPEDVPVTAEEIQRFIDEVNSGYPDLNLTLKDVTLCNYGLVLFGQEQKNEKDLSYGKRSLVIDHDKEHNFKQLISLIGVRATTAREEAERAIDLVQKKLKQQKVHANTDVTPIAGGDIPSFSKFYENALPNFNRKVSDQTVLAFLKNYGDRYEKVLEHADPGEDPFATFPGTHVFKAEIPYAIHEEMAVCLSDVVFRRTELCSGEKVEESVLQEVAETMAKHMGWNCERTQSELQTCSKRFTLETKEN